MHRANYPRVAGSFVYGPQSNRLVLILLRVINCLIWTGSEQAIDYKNMNQISAIFEIYKTKSEQYLNSNGRNWRQLYKAYVDKVKAEKEAAKGK
jgi:fructose-1,6-bisphosphatase